VIIGGAKPYIDFSHTPAHTYTYRYMYVQQHGRMYASLSHPNICTVCNYVMCACVCMYAQVSNVAIDTLLYDHSDLVHSMERIDLINYHQEGEHNGIRFWCYNAGHVLGAAMFMVDIDGTKVCMCVCMCVCVCVCVCA